MTYRFLKFGDELPSKLMAARRTLGSAIAEHRPNHIFSLFSGGHDSVSVTHFAASTLGNGLAGIVHINTGIGIPETRQYVRETCKSFGWNLLEYKATENTNAKGEPDPQVYEDLVVRLGFPGARTKANGHGMMYARLKERQLRRLARDYGASSKHPIMLIAGCRKEESTRRMGNTKAIDRQGRFVWVNPFLDMTALDCSEYMKREGIPRNPVKDRLHISGECLCGAFAKPGELSEIELWYPKTAAHIKRIEAKVREAGFPWGWEESPPAWWTNRQTAKKAGQSDAFEEEAEREIQYLCVGCTKGD